MEIPTEELVDFNPRSPCGERPSAAALAVGAGGISIHAPRVGSDKPGHPTRPENGRISIHAPRVGSDCKRVHRVRRQK